MDSCLPPGNPKQCKQEDGARGDWIKGLMGSNHSLQCTDIHLKKNKKRKNTKKFETTLGILEHQETIILQKWVVQAE